MAKFNETFRKSLERTKEKVRLTAEGATILLFSSVVRDSPLDTGALRANWLPSVDSPRIEKINGIDTTGELSVQDIQETVTAGKMNYLFNSLPYAPVIEYGLYPNPPKNPTGRTQNGYSTQAPQGMVGINAMRWSNYIKTAAELQKK